MINKTKPYSLNDLNKKLSELTVQQQKVENEWIREELMTRTLNHMITRDVPSLYYLKDKVQLLDREYQNILSGIQIYESQK